MKKRELIPLVVLLVLILGSFGIALADGGADPNACLDPLPPPSSGPFVRGDFTVAFDKRIDSFPHYNFHAVLKYTNDIHLFSAPQKTWVDKTLCDFTASDIKELLKFYPCWMDVGGYFGIIGTPVIADLTITKQDQCTDPINAMIMGEVVIRVVPPPK